MSVSGTFIPVPSVIIDDITSSWVQLYDTSGVLIAVFDDWVSLDVTHTLNSYSTLTLIMDDTIDDTRFDLFTLDSIVEVWRRIGDYIYIEYQGFHRVSQRALDADQKATFTSIGRGFLDLVHRRMLFYQGVIKQTLKQAPADQVIYEIVNENCGPAATSPPRFSAGVTPSLAVIAPIGGGSAPIWTGQLDNSNVLDIIASIAVTSGADFDIVLVGKNPIAFEFRTYYPQRGVDRSAMLAFDSALGNMTNILYNIGYDVEINSVAALGTGTDSARHVAVFQGTDLAASPWNILEGTVDASDQDTYEGMQTAAETYLKTAAAVETFTFDVVQSDTIQYGRDYAVGDVITARFRDISKVKKIVGATFSAKEGQDIVTVTFSDLPV